MTYARAPQPVTFPDALRPDTRLLIRGGRVVDPAHAIDAVRDLAVADGRILEVAGAIHPERGDRIIDAEGLLVLPGLIDLHCHFHDLFDISTMPATEVVAHGTTVALTPGAGNTLMAPALLGAEVDRGLPLHVGCYIGAAAVLATRATPEQLIAYFRGDLADSTQLHAAYDQSGERSTSHSISGRLHRQPRSPRTPVLDGSGLALHNTGGRGTA